MAETIYTLLRYIDEKQRFGYVQFFNFKDHFAFLPNKPEYQIVITIDTENGYFNASKLFETCCIVPNLTLSAYMNTATFKYACTVLNNQLEDENRRSHIVVEGLFDIPKDSDDEEPDPPEENEDDAKPLTAYVQIAKTKDNNLIYGYYFHPKLLLSLLSTINPLFSIEMSSFIFTYLVHGSINKDLTVSNLLPDEVNKFKTDFDQYEEMAGIVIDSESDNIEGFKRKCKSKVYNTLMNSKCFDLVQFFKTKSYKNDYFRIIASEITEKKKSAKSRKANQLDINTKHFYFAALETPRAQAIIAVAHYDPSGRFGYGSKMFKLTLDLVGEEDLPSYIQYFKKPVKPAKVSEAEFERYIITGKKKVSTDIVAKFVSLHDVPPNFVREFISQYDRHFEVELKIIDNVEYVIVYDLDDFKRNFSDYLSPFMKW